MRRVNVLTGIKQRINEILGTADKTSGDLTAWSIQSAMLSNFQRICKAMTLGQTFGRIMSGLDITGVGGTDLTISSGYGITKNGNLITIPGAFTYDMSENDDGVYYVSLQYSLVQFPGESPGYPEGKLSPTVNEGGLTQIVWDELGASNVGSTDTSIVSIASSTSSIGGDMVYIGTVTISSGVISAISKSLVSSSGQVVARVDSSATAQSISNSSWTKINFDSEQYDTADEFSSSLYTAKSAGFRQVSFKVSSVTGTGWDDFSKYWRAQAVVNGDVNNVRNIQGTWTQFAYPGSSDRRESVGSALIYLGVGDTVQINVIHNYGTAISVETSFPHSHFTISTITED